MAYLGPDFHDIDIPELSISLPASDPRVAMHERFSPWLQPFLTWLTARPAPGEPLAERSPLHFVTVGLAQITAGVALAWIGCLLGGITAWCTVIPLGLLLSASGLGLFQVVVFHHCSHGTVFKTRENNIIVGRMISAILLFKHFDIYKREHMVHHSTNKLLTEDDEFASFVFGMCGLEAALPKRELWRRVLVNLVSPRFHGLFLLRRVRAAFGSHDPEHNRIGMSVWTAMTLAALVSGQFVPFLIAVVLPVTVLLQAATVFRILCEHRFPDPELIARRGKDFACHATSGVFPGSAPPAPGGLRGALALAAWWLDMLTVQMFVRLFILVGDAPCHDYHHRRPASRRWTTYIQARQADSDAGSPGFGMGYLNTWGLFRAVDQTLESLASTPLGVVAH